MAQLLSQFFSSWLNLFMCSLSEPKLIYHWLSDFCKQLWWNEKLLLDCWYCDIFQRISLLFPSLFEGYLIVCSEMKHKNAKEIYCYIMSPNAHTFYDSSSILKSSIQKVTWTLWSDYLLSFLKDLFFVHFHICL